jgi:hypothetical protein
MWKISFDTKDFIKIKEGISKVFMTLPIEIGKGGYKIKNMSQTKEAAITINFDKEDMKEFECTNKNDVTFTLPFAEFLDAVKKIKTPVEFGEEGTAKVYIKSDRVTFVLDKQQDIDPDVQKLYDGIIKTHTKDGTTKLIIGQGDFIDAVDQLSFSTGGVVMTVVNKQLTFESLKGSLAAKYVMDMDVDEKFEWTGSFNTEYMKMIKNLAYYSTNVNFFVKEPEEDKPLAVIVELAIAANSDVSFIMAGLKEDDMLEEDDDDEDSEAEETEEEFVFEEDDAFYTEEE